MNETANSKNAKTKRSNQPTSWPWQAQLLLVLVALGTACFLLIWIPMQFVFEAVAPKPEGSTYSLYSMIAVFIGLTTMTISAMFLFMTFRIDRGTKTAAREEARNEAERITRDTLDLDKAKLKTITELKDLKEAIDEVKQKGNAARNRIEEIEKDERARIERARIRIETVGTKTSEELEGKKEEAIDELERKKKGAIDELEGKKEEAIDELEGKKKGAIDELEGKKEEAIDELEGKKKGAIDELEGKKKGAIDELEGKKEEAIDELEGKKKGAIDELVWKGNTARDRIEEIEKDERARIETVGTETSERIAGETRERVDRMVENARRKIDEADIETLVNEEFARRGRLFRWFSRRREPRS